MATKSVQRTLTLLKENGFSAYVVEKFNPHVGRFGIREDFMGFIDIIALSPRYGIIGVQACGSDWAPHITKIHGERLEPAKLWAAAGGRIWLVGWRKLKQRKKDGSYSKVSKYTPRFAEWNNVEEKLVEVSGEIIYFKSC